MSPELKARIALNWKTLKQSYAARVVAVISTAGAWWLAKTDVEQATWLKTHELFAPLVPYAPAIGFGVYVVFRLWPQFFPHMAPADPRLKQLDELLEKAKVIGAAPAAPTVVVQQAPAAPPPAPEPPAPSPAPVQATNAMPGDLSTDSLALALARIAPEGSKLVNIVAAARLLRGGTDIKS